MVSSILSNRSHYQQYEIVQNLGHNQYVIAGNGRSIDEVKPDLEQSSFNLTGLINRQK